MRSVSTATKSTLGRSGRPASFQLFWQDGATIVVLLPACSRELRVKRYPDGALYLENEWRGRVRDGRRVVYFTDGKKESEGRYADGLLDGPWTAWHPNGALFQQGAFVRGLRQGA